MVKKGKTIGIGVLALLLLGGGFGFGLGGGSGLGEGESAEPAPMAAVTEAAETTVETSQALRETTAVAVVENRYFYENRSIELPELLGLLKEIPDCLVEISDENASLQAYNALLESLQQEGILYVENFGSRP